LAWLGTETVVNGEILDPGPFVRPIFEQAGARQTVVPPPSGANNRTFWDLKVTDMDIDFNSDSTEAQVNCRLILWGAKAEHSQKVKQTSETFRFKRIGEAWNLVGFDNLLDFLWVEVSGYEED